MKYLKVIELIGKDIGKDIQTIEFLRHVVDFCNHRPETENENKSIAKLFNEYAKEYLDEN